MLAEILISLFLIPIFHDSQFNFDGFLNLGDSAGEANAPQRMYTDYLDVKITAQSAIAIDAQSGKILYKKNQDLVLPIASITKLMTALVFLDHNPGWQTEWTMMPADRRNGGIEYLIPGEKLTIENLFKTALIVSDNDAAAALARASGLSDQAFVREMNTKAKVLGLTSVQFSDPTGLYRANQANSADVAKLLNYALKNKDIAKTTNIASYEFEILGQKQGRTVKLKNTDSLLKSYLNIVGGKTGSLDENGYNLAVKIKGDKNQEIIVVTLGSQSNSDRFQDVKAITDWVFNNFIWK